MVAVIYHIHIVVLIDRNASKPQGFELPFAASLAVPFRDQIPSLVENQYAAVPFHEIAADTALRTAYPAESRFLDVEIDDLRTILATAPLESFDRPVQGLTLALPLPGGASAEFEVWEAPVMHPDLQARYPEIRTYRGRGIDDPYATVRLDATPAGFHAMVLSRQPTVFIDPVAFGDDRNHVTHYKRTAAERPEVASFQCDFTTDPEVEREIDRLIETRRGLRQTGEQLRTYRTCVACTGEYANTSGGTVPGALAAITTSVSRVTGVYERECSVRFELIANNDDVIFLDPNTDPYTNNNGGAMLGQNQTTLTNIIGSANYDLGHVFSTGGGGVASLGVVCNNGSKARGVTGLPNPHGDNSVLTIWEAQFGDFVNGAQVIIDQFITSAHVKWGRMSGLVMLLPHGYEGQGPEHSSARIERFLQACAGDNLQVVNCSKPAQYFHVLRRQMRRSFRAPLVILTPKSLLRLARAASRVHELAQGRFWRVIPDAAAGVAPQRVRRVILCSGKVYYDLLEERERRFAASLPVAIVRVEELHPWPAEEIAAALRAFPEAREVVWTQEEPANMGAWSFARELLSRALLPTQTLAYAGRPASASPAAGSLRIHKQEQAALLEAAFEGQGA
jgi:hypothetical protein